MIIILVVLLIVALASFYYFLGENDAILWSMQGAGAYDEGIRKNEHVILMAVRIAAAAAVLLATFLDWYIVVLVLLASVAGFPFIHNGSYYIGRNRIARGDGLTEPYPKEWKSEPPINSSARINFTYQKRLTLFYIYIGVNLAALTLTII